MTVSFKNIFPDNVLAYVSDRSCDFKLQPEQNDLTPSQKEFLSAQLKHQFKDFGNVRQIHGKRVIVHKDSPQVSVPLEEADALITNIPNFPIVVRTADCLSVFIYDPKNKAVGIVHSGWQGTRQNITGETVQQMVKVFSSDPKELKIAFGPCIRPCCYEVGDEFKGYFPKEVSVKNNKLCFDNAKANLNQLLALGVKQKNVYDCGECTHCNNKYFSFRRDAEGAGRMISLMMLT